MRRVLFLFALGTSLLVSACQADQPFECSDVIGCVTVAPDAPLKLGVIQDLSGGGAVFGVEQVNSFELAIADRGDQLLGHSLEFQVEDEVCTPEGGGNAALRIAADPQVVGVFGTTCSGAAETAMDILSEAGLVMVSGVNSGPSLTAIGDTPGEAWRPGYYRTMMNVVEEARVGAAFAFRELGIKRAATIDDGDTFSQGYADVFEQTFVELGGEIVLDATVNKGDADMHPVLTAVADAEATLVFLSLFPPEGALVVQQAGEVGGLENVIFLGGGALRTDTFLKSVGAKGQGMYFIGSAPPPEGTASDKLVTGYVARYGESPQTVTYGYA